MTAAVRLPGLSGHLLGESFLVSLPDLPADLDGHRRALAELHVSARRHLGPASSQRAILESIVTPALSILGFEEPGAVRPSVLSGTSLVGTVRLGATAVCVLVASWGEPLDRFWRAAVVDAREREASWCLLTNGVSLRIVDAGQLYSRRYLEVDLPLALEDAASFAALWRTASARALCAGAGDAESLHALVAGSDRHAAGVRRSLRDGVLTASAAVLNALVSSAHRGRFGGAALVADSFEQAVTIVYRIVFLLFAEARSLVPLWHPVYRESYTIASLCDLAERAGQPERAAAPGLWDALRAIARLAHAGCRAGDLRVTPFNGRLFAPSRTPLAERRNLDDHAARTAIVALSTRGGRERIVYRDLGVEQLGAVYETLLDYRPVAAPAPRERTAPIVTLESGSGARKSSGTFYTPQPVADHLIRRTLAPLVRDADPEAILRLRIVDPAMGSGAFLVSACRYLASAYERALIAAGRCHPSDIDEGERIRFRRAIAERCLYGVDVNPMAVQLARLSLWLTTLAADRPLSFLDHRLTTGDSLLGAWLTNLRRKPTARVHRRDDRLPLFAGDAAAVEALTQALPVRFALESTPNDTLEQVRSKERELAALSNPDHGLSRWKRVADLWCAAFFSGFSGFAAAFHELSEAALGGAGALPAHRVREFLDEGRAIASARRFFHWELEFPEAFFDANGRRSDSPGFDAVIGNPPWEMMRADTGEAGARRRTRRDVAAVVRFVRESGIFAARDGTSGNNIVHRGHINCYQLFAERALDLTRPGGRIGLVVPAGLAADHGSSGLRRQLLSRCDVDGLVGVDNHRGIFPIHRSVRFLLLTATAGSSTRTIACRFGVDSTRELDEEGPVFPVRLTAGALERLSGPSLSIPYVRSVADVAILERATTLFPPLGHDNGWRARFGRELNATDDRDAFRPGRHGLPVLDGKHVSPFRARVGDSSRSIGVADALRRVGSDRFARARLAYRDVAGATNRLTLIAAILPAGCVSTHTLFCLRTPLPLRDQQFLCGLFNSFVVNYLVRLRVSTHVTTAIVEQLPLPTRDTDPRACREIAALARRLVRHDDRAALARLNALVAMLYQLTNEELARILDTFPLVPQGDRDAAMREFLSTLGH